jgi:hypothetical protein
MALHEAECVAEGLSVRKADLGAAHGQIGLMWRRRMIPGRDRPRPCRRLSD